jgi:RNA polymerase sigma-70 factor (ECF subfamily)
MRYAGPLQKLTVLFSRTDEESMARVRTHGDHRDFSRLVERWEKPILNLCARMTGDLHRAEDLKQEVFARVFEKRQDFDPSARFSTWLWRIALNRCYDELRQRERRREFMHSAEGGEAQKALEQFIEDGPSPDARAAQVEEGQVVRQALMELPEIYRTVLVLRHYEGMKLARIAEVLDVPEGTVNSRMAEALARLTRLLEPRLHGSKELNFEPEQVTKPNLAFVL